MLQTELQVRKNARRKLTVALARHEEEVREAQRLRYKVFAEEMGARVPGGGQGLDIYAIMSVRSARFVAKSEVRAWPVIGWLSERAGTMFIERARKRHAAQIGRQMAAALEQGDTVLPFRPSLLQSALACDAPVYPIAIRYLRADGARCSEANYEGDTSFVDSLLLMVSQPVIHARLDFLPPLECIGRHRRELAKEAARRVSAALGLPAPI